MIKWCDNRRLSYPHMRSHCPCIRMYVSNNNNYYADDRKRRDSIKAGRVFRSEGGRLCLMEKFRFLVGNFNDGFPLAFHAMYLYYIWLCRGRNLLTGLLLRQGGVYVRVQRLSGGRDGPGGETLRIEDKLLRGNENDCRWTIPGEESPTVCSHRLPVRLMQKH